MHVYRWISLRIKMKNFLGWLVPVNVTLLY